MRYRIRGIAGERRTVGAFEAILSARRLAAAFAGVVLLFFAVTVTFALTALSDSCNTTPLI